MTTQDGFGTPGPPADGFGTPTGGRGHDYADAEARAAVPRDQWDRYLIPGPDGIKPAVNKGRTRVSTTKSVGSDQTRLQARAERLIIQGLGMDPHLNAEAMRANALPTDSKEQKRAIARVALAAFERAGGNERRDKGTEFHELIESLTKDPATPVPDHLVQDNEAYWQALTDHGLKPVPELSECVVICPYDHGGAIDSIARRWNPDTEMYEYIVVDLKTGRSLDYSKMEFLSQLWFYTNAYYRFITTAIDRDKGGKITAVRGYMEELPLELRRDRAILIHVPLDGSASVYELDLSGIDRQVAAQIELRRANAEAQHKYRLLGTVRPGAFVSQNDNATHLPPLETRQGVVVVPADQGPVQYQDGTTVYASPLMAEHRVSADAGLTLKEADQRHATIIDELNNAVNPGAWKVTPDQQARIDKADERRAVAAQVLANVAPGQLPGDATKPPAPTHGPVTGRKKRTCGHCHNPGHTQKNCPENPASDKYVKPELKVVPEPDGDPAPGVDCDCQGDGDLHPLGTGGCRWTDPVARDALASTVARANALAVAEGRNDDGDETDLPYCQPGTDHPGKCQWTSQPPAPPMTWGCSITGKPAEMAWKAGTTAVTKEPLFYGMPNTADPETAAALIAHRNTSMPGRKPLLAADYADGDDAPPPPATWDAPLWNKPPDMVAWEISNAQSVTDLLRHRDACIAAGTWNEAYENQGMIRYQALNPMPGTPS